MFTAMMVAMYAGYLVALRYVPGMRLSARWAIVTVVAVHAILFLAPPMSLTDVFNYINYGRMEIVHHLNPYTTLPISEPHSDPSYALSNWHELLSPYGPLFTLLTFALVPLGVAGRSGRSRRSSCSPAWGRSCSSGAARGCWTSTRSGRSCSSA